jgi:hypothetical protein
MGSEGTERRLDVPRPTPTRSVRKVKVMRAHNNAYSRSGMRSVKTSSDALEPDGGILHGACRIVHEGEERLEI